MASLIRRGGRSAHHQLHIIFLMLPTKNCKRGVEFVKVIIRNIISIFYIGYNKNGIFDDIIITSTLRSDKLILKAMFLVKRIIGIIVICAKDSKIRLNLLKLFAEDSRSFFPDTV